MKAVKMMKKAKAAKARVAAAQAKGQAAAAKVQSKVAQGQAAASKIQSKVSQAQSQVQSMKNQAIAAATIEPRIQPPPAPALEQPVIPPAPPQPVIKSEPNVNMSVVQPYPSTAGMPMQQTLEAADPKMAVQSG